MKLKKKETSIVLLFGAVVYLEIVGFLEIAAGFVLLESEADDNLSVKIGARDRWRGPSGECGAWG